MNTPHVRPGNPDEARALLEASHALMESLFPSESNHYLSIDALKSPDIRFLICEVDGHIAGCGAVALQPGYGEVKSMFTDPDHRGQGIADAVLEALTQVARAEGLRLMRLETGYKLAAAHRLYERHGFTGRGPFGDYTDDPLSLFMEKTL
jgi:putative acetyltransferase